MPLEQLLGCTAPSSPATPAKTGCTAQFTSGVVGEGVIAENIPQISAKFPQTFRRISAPFPGGIKRSFRELSAEFPQNFRKKPFANDPIS